MPRKGGEREGGGGKKHFFGPLGLRLGLKLGGGGGARLDPPLGLFF